MSRGTILAHKHTLCEAFTGFFRALATERFSEVRNWLHPELEQLVRNQCERLGEGSFLRGLRHGLGSATQRVRLGASQAEGARQIKTELLSPTGTPAGMVRFVLSPDGWRIYSVEVWTSSKGGPPSRPSPQIQQQRTQTQSRPVIAQRPPKKKSRSRMPKMLPQKWLSTICPSH